VNEYNPIDLLFGGMEKLGPGSDAHTLRVLDLLPRDRFDVVVDAGCGAGRQTLALARRLGTPVDAVDSYEPFLSALARRAREAGMERLVRPHCMDMKEIPGRFREIGLLWSEGAAYNIGFANALESWAPAVRPDGYVVVSELSWLRADPPEAVREFFSAGYPEMRSLDQNVTLARSARYELLGTHTLPEEAWVDGYYDVLEPRARALTDHSEPAVRDFAAETIREIEVFRRAEGSYGYVFYLLQRA
jgi:SAM-dependent methyltransferase